MDGVAGGGLPQRVGGVDVDLERPAVDHEGLALGCSLDGTDDDEVDVGVFLVLTADG